MELNSVMPSILPGQQQTDEEVESTSKTIKWDKEISFDKAYKALEDAFYSFKEVNCMYKLNCQGLVAGSYIFRKMLQEHSNDKARSNKKTI